MIHFFLEVEIVFFSDTITELYFGIGDINSIRLNQGYYELCIGTGSFINCNGSLTQMRVDIDDVEREENIQSLMDNLDENDTLIIYNQTVLFN